MVHLTTLRQIESSLADIYTVIKYTDVRWTVVSLRRFDEGECDTVHTGKREYRKNMLGKGNGRNESYDLALDVRT